MKRRCVAVLQCVALVLPAGCRAKHEAAEKSEMMEERAVAVVEHRVTDAAVRLSEQGEFVIEKPVIVVSGADGSVAEITGERLTGGKRREVEMEVSVVESSDSCGSVKVETRDERETLTETRGVSVWRYVALAGVVAMLIWWLRKKMCKCE